MALLEVKNLGIAFGGLKALKNVAITIEDKEIIGLIGPNGAGKTTVFNLLTDVYQPAAGSIELEGDNIIGKKTHQITQIGIARTFQNIRLFKDISVLDNIKIALHNKANYSVWQGVFRTRAYWREERFLNSEALRLLEVFQMRDMAEAPAGSLPYGKQRKLEIARALATSPKLLLLDEPAAGMNPTETRELMDTIRRLRDRFSVSILVIEHDMNLVMGLCERVFVLDYGEIIAAGAPEDISKNPKVIAAYLGEELPNGDNAKG